MAFRNLRLASPPSINGTSEPMGITHIPSNILEAFVPGYSFISRFFLEAFGFDVSIIVSVCALIFGFSTGFQFIYRPIYSLFEKQFTSAITIESYDDIYDYLISWVAEHHVSKQGRSLRAKSGQDSAWDSEGDAKISDQDFNSGALFNFSNWEAKVPPRFEPHTGGHWFRHRGHFFRFHRDKETILGSGYFSRVFSEEETITITVIGRSTAPIKRLIFEARDLHLSKEKSKTVVRRPSPKERRGNGRHAWNKVATRPSRPMETVVLDADQKASILADINEYLHPATPRWYANRGIPYRRGYLLYGPPGTGKTSLSFAIAGVFGLDIYCISLLEPTLTEEDLGLLFNSLPRRCVVLLEDIDSAGLHRKGAQVEEEEKGAAKKDGKADDASDAIAKEVAKAFKSVNDRQDRENNRKGQNTGQGISLSGLLNAIDGVASHEGRVLVMTTNYPEKLDDALIRPGRVDMKIEFSLASKKQIRELFIRMYSSDSGRTVTYDATGHVREQVKTNGIGVNGHAKKSSVVEEKNSKKPKPISLLSTKPTAMMPTPPDTPKVSTSPTRPFTPTEIISIPESDNLEDLADAFAATLPAATFSPAEIQGFLLTRKKEPLRALKEVGAWKEATLDAKKKGDNGVVGAGGKKDIVVEPKAKDAVVGGGGGCGEGESSSVSSASSSSDVSPVSVSASASADDIFAAEEDERRRGSDCS